MRIKTQFLISIITFSIVLIIIGSSVAVTQQQIAEFNGQEAFAHDIQTGASDLNYISNNYFLYQDNSSIELWQTKFSALSDKLAVLNSANPQQQALVNTVSGDMANLNTVFAGVTSYLTNAPRNVSIRVLPSFQTQWNMMAVQIQALAFDSQQLSQSIRDQTNQAITQNTILTIALLASFAAFFITSYIITYQKTLKSISKLESGINIIGTGNLGYVIEAGKNDEVADISKSVNQMATNLKTVTASKVELEKEISERKNAEQMLAKSEQRWATTLSSIGDAVIATDLSGKITFMNGVAEEMTGWALSEASQKSVNEVFNIINEQTRLEVENPIHRVLKEGMVVGLANHTILLRKDRTEVPIDDSGAPIKDKEGKTTGVVLVFRDISDRKQMETKLEEYTRNLEELVEQRTKQLRDSERLAAIGATAGMVGHDIRNPLQAITSDAYLAKIEVSSMSESEEKKNALESLGEIEKNIDYINKIVQDLQDYARPLNPQAEESDIKTMIEKFLAKNSLPENVKVTLKVEDEARKINADSYYLNRIVYNLVTNSVQAMPKGGKLTINAYREKNDVVISVKDTGVGIPKEIQGKMFTPMFTTKSKGQGFGLPVVKRMSESLGGTVTFESQEGKGTTFIVRLPIQGIKRTNRSANDKPKP
jgi:PAS domain S-box-containing protein